MTNEISSEGGMKTSQKSNNSEKKTKKSTSSTVAVSNEDSARSKTNKKPTIKDLIPENEMNLYHVYYNLIHRKDVTVCEEWLKGYDYFRDWAMNNGYKDGARIIRVDKTLPFEPSNTIIEVPKYNQNMKRLAAIAKGHSDKIYKFSYKD